MHSQIILVTGGCGFIGSNFIPYFLNKYPQYVLLNVDSLTYAADLVNISDVVHHPRYQFIQGDICDQALLHSLFDRFQIHAVIHFAAESHVDNSIRNPEIFIRTNIQGTFALLEVAREYWTSRVSDVRSLSEHRFLHVSTDEVYGSLGPTGVFFETSPYQPNSPYSASKASADLLVRSYHKTFALNTITTHCSNNFGPKQHDEKLIPTIIRKCVNQESIPIYGDGQNVRDWLYVLDHCKGIDLAFHKGSMGEIYNIGANNEFSNEFIAKMICQKMELGARETNSQTLFPSRYETLIQYVQDRPGHDKRYALNADKIQEKLGWIPEENFESGLEKTILWYQQKYSQKEECK